MGKVASKQFLVAISVEASQDGANSPDVGRLGVVIVFKEEDFGGKET